MPLPIDAIHRMHRTDRTDRTDRSSDTSSVGEADPKDISPEVVATAQGMILRVLEGAADQALTRAEIGEGLRGLLLGAVGVELDAGVRDTLLSFARLFSSRVDRELVESARVVDAALTELVVSARIGFAVHLLEARYWANSKVSGTSRTSKAPRELV